MTNAVLFTVLSCVLAVCALAYGRVQKKAKAQSAVDRREYLKEQARRP